MPIIEIGYHAEPIINNGDRETKVWHMHVYNGLVRGDAEWLTEEVKIKYAVYIEEMSHEI